MGTAIRGSALKRAGGSAAREPLLHEATTRVVLSCFFGVYNELGAGFIESVYSRALAVSLRAAGARVQREVPVSVLYRGVEVGRFRADMLVEGVVLVEVKAAESIAGAHVQQVINYLTATRLETALLLNFGPRPSLKRLVLSNTHRERP